MVDYLIARYRLAGGTVKTARAFSHDTFTWGREGCGVSRVYPGHNQGFVITITYGWMQRTDRLVE